MKTELLVSIRGDHLVGLARIVEKLEAEGLEVGHTLPALGTVTGAIDESRIDLLRSIEGVETVERSREVRATDVDTSSSP